MRDLLLFPLLIGYQNGLPGIVVHDDRSIFHLLESLILDLLKVDKRQGKTIPDKGSEFFHQIESEARSSGTVPVKKSDSRVESHRSPMPSGHHASGVCK